MEEDQIGVKLGGKFYPLDNVRIKPTDTRLLRDLLGMSMEEWAKSWKNGEFEGLLGLTACAIARENPDWSRSNVIEYMEQFDLEELEEVLPKRADADPPAEAGTAPPTLSSTPSNTSSSEPADTTSTETPDSPSEPSPLRSIGPAASPGSQEEPSRLTV